MGRALVNKDSITNNPKVRVKKREAVIPFYGEENFIVPKRGGFAQPDNENYVMVVGSTSRTPTTTTTTPSTPSDGSTNTTTGTNIPIGSAGEPIPTGTTTTTTNPAPAEPNPSTISTPPVATAQQLCVSNGGLWVNGTCQTSPAPEPLPAETTCIANGGAWINGACVTSTSPKTLATTTTTVADAPLVDTLPNFPNWSSLDCTTLRDKIAEYNAILSTSKFSQTVVEAYNTEIAKAQAIYNTKCNVPTPAPAPASPSISVLPVGGGGIFGGGGGGGLGEPPTDVAPVVEEKSNLGLYLILGGLALLYFLTRKKKK